MTKSPISPYIEWGKSVKNDDPVEFEFHRIIQNTISIAI